MDETVERISFYELFVPDRREFAMIFGTEHCQTFAIDATPSAAAEQADSDAADQAREAREAGIMDGAAS